MVYCKKCGAEVSEKHIYCPQCGYSLPKNESDVVMDNQNSANNAQSRKSELPQGEFSEKNGMTVLILAIFLGGFGVHSFYVGRTGIGIAQIFTLGGCGIWALVDIIMLVMGSYRDGEGKLVQFK